MKLLQLAGQTGRSGAGALSSAGPGAALAPHPWPPCSGCLVAMLTLLLMATMSAQALTLRMETQLQHREPGDMQAATAQLVRFGRSDLARRTDQLRIETQSVQRENELLVQQIDGNEELLAHMQGFSGVQERTLAVLKVSLEWQQQARLVAPAVPGATPTGEPPAAAPSVQSHLGAVPAASPAVPVTQPAKTPAALQAADSAQGSAGAGPSAPSAPTLVVAGLALPHWLLGAVLGALAAGLLGWLWAVMAARRKSADSAPLPAADVSAPSEDMRTDAAVLAQLWETEDIVEAGLRAEATAVVAKPLPAAPANDAKESAARSAVDDLVEDASGEGPVRAEDPFGTERDNGMADAGLRMAADEAKDSGVSTAVDDVGDAHTEERNGKGQNNGMADAGARTSADAAKDSGVSTAGDDIGDVHTAAQDGAGKAGASIDPLPDRTPVVENSEISSASTVVESVDDAQVADGAEGAWTRTMISRKAANPQALKEVDTLIAFEQFEKAKALLDQLLVKEPDNPEYMLRHYHVRTHGGTDTNDDDEELLRAMMDGPMSDTLLRVREIGRGMMPGDPLFDGNVQRDEAVQLLKDRGGEPAPAEPAEDEFAQAVMLDPATLMPVDPANKD